MLAKEIKIGNIGRQRRDIRDELKKLNGRSIRSQERIDTLYIFFGDLYPENFKYFQDEGFSINQTKAIKNVGQYSIEVPAYIFSVGSVKLSTEELKSVEINESMTTSLKKASDSSASDLSKTN